MPTITPEEIKDFESSIADMRMALLEMEGRASGLKVHPILDPDQVLPLTVNRGEVIANITIAFRAIEDARMRFGKVFQACNGGESNNTR